MNTALGIATLIMAGIAATGAIVAARLAASASTNTTRLAAQLSEAGELQKWQRQEFLTRFRVSRRRPQTPDIRRCPFAPHGYLFPAAEHRRRARIARI